MSRIVPVLLLSQSRQPLARIAVPGLRRFNTSKSDNSQDSTPGWTGRGTEDHAVKRSGHDVQSEASQKGMKAHENKEEGGQAITRKDEGNQNKKAKQDHPEAPEPVIGMNEERGKKGH